MDAAEFDRLAAEERAARATVLAVERLMTLDATPPARIVHRRGRRPLVGCADRSAEVQRILDEAVVEGADRRAILRRWQGCSA